MIDKTIDNICNWLVNRISKNDATLDEEKLEIIYYGLQNIIGELPKGMLILTVALILGVFRLVLLGTIVLLIYRGFAGGVHLKTHLSCFLTSTLLVVGGAFLAKNYRFETTYLLYSYLAIINLAVAIMYAPADTESRPIMKKSQRTRQKIESVCMVIVVYILSMFVVKEQMISNLFMYMITVESFMITPFAYKIFKNETGEARRNEILNSM